MENVLIVGALGFIGFHLTKELLEQGITVHALDLSYKAQNDDMKDEKLFEIGRNANFINVVSLDGTENLDVIFICFEQEGMEDEDYVKAFHIQLRESIKWCQINTTKLIFPSTLSVVKHNVQTITEETECQPLNPVGDLLLSWEKEISKENSLVPFSYLILRFPTLYGPWQPDSYAYQQALVLENKKQKTNIIKDFYTEDILFISDAIQAIINSSNLTTPEILHITSGKSNEWEKGLNLILGKTYTVKSSDKIKLSNEKAVKVLGYHPTVELEEGIAIQRNHFLQRRSKV